MEKAWDYLASYTVGERPNASEVNDLIAAIEDRMNQPETFDVAPEVTPDVKPVQVSPLEFISAAFDKEFLYGKPIMWAEWPNRVKEKNT